MQPNPTFVIPGLATVEIDTRPNGEPLIKIVLDPQYQGDLNDLEQRNEFPAGVFLQCDSTSCIDNPDLAKFMEILHHWDHDYDGVYDGDAVADAIEEALWRSREAPDVFERPSTGIYTRLLMALMPPAPDRHIVFGFGELKQRFRWYHYAWSIPALLVVLALVQVQIHYVPWTQYSVITGWVAGAKLLGFNELLALAAFVIVLQILRRSRRRDADRTSMLSKHTYGFFSKAAVFEEQAFREGAESWSWRQRATSCLVFGAIHMLNLIYPIATILPLALGGALFMVVYLRTYKRTHFRRSAVLASAIVHRVYNRIALTVVVISLTLILGSWVFGVLAAFALVVGMAVLDARWIRQQVSAQLSSVM